MMLKMCALIFAFILMPIWPVSVQSVGGLKVYSSAESQHVYDPYQRALDFKATDLRGNSFDARSLKGHIVLLDFWAVWCAPCIAAIPVLNKLNKDFNSKGFKVVGVASYSGTAEDVSEFIRKHKVDYTVVIGDDDLVERFEVIGYPTYFLIAPDGSIYKKYVGEVKGLYNELASDIAALQTRSKAN